MTPWQSIWVLCLDHDMIPELWSSILGLPVAQFRRFKVVEEVRTLPMDTRVIISSMWSISKQQYDVGDDIFSSDGAEADQLLALLRSRNPILLNP